MVLPCTGELEHGSRDPTGSVQHHVWHTAVPARQGLPESLPQGTESGLITAAAKHGGS